VNADALSEARLVEGDNEQFKKQNRFGSNQEPNLFFLAAKRTNFGYVALFAT